ncbi:MAG: hypothetical protein QF491_12290, partial [Alphaproteobacteria bacterium]|nr:hypothetical protein [Alphaproteobacteria bacterium]
KQTANSAKLRTIERFMPPNFSRPSFTPNDNCAQKMTLRPTVSRELALGVVCAALRTEVLGEIDILGATCPLPRRNRRRSYHMPRRDHNTGGEC